MADPTAPDRPWYATFETGDAELDAQHKQLLADSGQLKDLVLSGGSWVDVRNRVDALIKDCAAHFRSEEELLQKTGFPRCAEHTAQHRRIESMLEEFAIMVARVTGEDPQHRQLAASLEMKIIDIIVRHDLDYKSHLMNLAGL
ncbi:bacteriohemerythrin [Dongia sp.]|uniref:bacteriohemerythrin n=1 Tax=Dongia sp. TaxID=1977262 RepID=UPI0035B0D3DA